MADTDEPKAPLSDEAIAAALRGDLEEAASFIDSTIGPERAKATEYYRGDDFGDEEDGRSSIVMPVVRDTIKATLPGIMRTFFGTEQVVEFVPPVGSGAAGQQEARDKTATVNHVLMNQNNGWLMFYNAFKDALRGRTGWITWYWDDSKQVKGRTYRKVTEDQLQAFLSVQDPDEEVKVVDKTQVGTQKVPVGVTQQLVQGPQGPMMQPVPIMADQPVFEYTIRVISRKAVDQVRVVGVPPEEIIFTPEAADIDDASGCRPPRLIGRRQNKSRGALSAMGIPDDILEKAGTSDTNLSFNVEALARGMGGNPLKTSSGAATTEDQKDIVFYDVYYRIDADQDGISELRHIQAVGANVVIWKDEYADDVRLALLCPDPEPHVLIGLSQADSTMDLQLLQSHVWRDVLDSLKASIFPRVAYVEGQVNVDDVMNTELGGAIRMRAPGMAQPFEHPFTGQKALPLFDMFDRMRESRTGIGAAATGQDGSALQSTTPAAAMSALSASTNMVELMCRVFAETGMKRIFRGVLKLLMENQDKELQFSINGHDYVVNPSKWKAGDEMSIDTGLGNGNSQQKISALGALKDEQKALLGTMGPDNPLCSLQEYYNTVKKLLQYSGIRDVSNYWRDPTQAMQAGKKIQPQKSESQTLAEAEMQIKGAELERDKLKLVMDDDFRRDELEINSFLEARKIGVSIAELKQAKKQTEQAAA